MTRYSSNFNLVQYFSPNISPLAIQQFIDESSAPFNYPSAPFNEWAFEFGFLEKEENTGNFRPTGLGIMLFGKAPEHSFPQTIFKVEVNYGKGESEFRDFKGALVTQLPAIVDFIKDKGLKFTMYKSSGRRKEVADFPFEVLLEAVSNAVIHRDYTIAGATNYLYIDPNKIIIRSPGEPIYPLKLEDLQNFDAPSLSRNPKIMYVFNQMKLAEQRGIGLKSMRNLPDVGFPLPTFRLKAGILEITFGRTKDYMAEKAGLKDLNLLTEEDKASLIYIQKVGSVSVSEFSSAFDLNIRTAARQLSRLVENKVLLIMGVGKATRYYPNN